MEKAHLSNRQEEGLPKAILFDWDNTLVDSWRTTYHVFNKTYMNIIQMIN